jgi:hypothetical protein
MHLWILEVIPEGQYTDHRSNQNFLLYESVTDATPEFVSSYYDYSQYTLSAPVALNLGEKWALYGGIDYKLRTYHHREPRDASNAFIRGKTQTNNWVTISAGLRKKMNAISSVTLTASSVVATSNNKFERYLPYNYTGYNFNLSYQLTY